MRPARWRGAGPTVCLCAGLLGLVPAGPARSWPAALSSEQRRAIEAVPDQAPYRVRSHYLTSNELRHDVFFSSIAGLGGAYLGVGADQNYTLAAVAGADLVWLVDIDAHVVQWHRIYAALVAWAPSPAELVSLIERGREAEVRLALRLRWGEAGEQTLWQALQRDRARIAAHLRQQRGRFRDGQPVSWLSDPALYAHIRRLAQQHRIQARVGDVTAQAPLRGIGDALRAAGLTLRVFYLSNVEQWFRYGPHLARNLSALPIDDRTLLLRTLARRELRAPRGDRWHYSVQPMADLLRRLQGPAPLRRVHDLIPEMARADPLDGTPGLSLLGLAAAAPMPLGRTDRPTPPPGSSARRLTTPPAPSWAAVVLPF
ncbi:MAG: hypothetical protein RMK29_11250 [Myxococcales bacterium]|nr:hypothetical protein [Myxococcota bacterium]MDW8282283.1 hypothetical protein [Myxococcales bacterium]